MTPAELNARLDSYLAVRSALGFRLQAERTLLRSFVEFLESKGEMHPIRAQLAVDWAYASSATRGGAGQAARLSMARKFLLHVRATVPETEIPDRGLITYARRPKPYIFSEAEIERLIASALACGPADCLRPHTLSTFIGTLAATGLRVGEAIRLKTTTSGWTSCRRIWSSAKRSSTSPESCRFTQPLAGCCAGIRTNAAGFSTMPFRKRFSFRRKARI
jgi:site-specific recombinase XerD